MPLPTVNMLWTGSPVGPTQRLSAASFLAAGHPVRFYAYDQPAGLPDSVELADANAVMPRAEYEAIRSTRNPSASTAANGFRLRLFEREAGLWADADVVCLKPIELTRPHLFGWESADRINNAVLHLPRTSPILADLAGAFRPWGAPYWLPRRKRLEVGLKRLLRIPSGPADLRRGTFGPTGLTAVASRHGLLGDAEPVSVFYPIPWDEAGWFHAPGETLTSRVAENTKAVHLWYEVLARQNLAETRPPSTSPLGRLFAQFGI